MSFYKTTRKISELNDYTLAVSIPKDIVKRFEHENEGKKPTHAQIDYNAKLNKVSLILNTGDANEPTTERSGEGEHSVRSQTGLREKGD